MERSLVFLILFLGSLWLIMDDFAGKKRISGIARGLLPNV